MNKSLAFHLYPLQNILLKAVPVQKHPNSSLHKKHGIQAEFHIDKEHIKRFFFKKAESFKELASVITFMTKIMVDIGQSLHPVNFFKYEH